LTAALAERRTLVAIAALLGVLTLVAFFGAISQQSAFSEYLGLARQCVELNDCPSRGGRTGGLPLYHGASWIRLLSYSLRAGHDQTRIQSIILAVWMLSVPITFLFLLRYLGLRAAVLALGLYFPLIVVGTDVTLFTYTNLLPLPFAIYYACMALFAERRRTGFAVVASVALAAAVSAELGGIVMVPFHLLLVAWAARRRVLAVLVCGLAVAVPFCLDSMDAAREILRQVPTVRFAVAVAIVVGVTALAARMSPRTLAVDSMPALDRVRTLMTAALIYSIATVWLANLLLNNGLPAPRYLLPASFPFLYLVGERMAALTMRATVALAAAESVALLLLPSAPNALLFLQVPVSFVVTLYAVATVVRLVRQRGAQAERGGMLWPALGICACAIALAAGDWILLAKRGAPQALPMAEAEPVVSALYAAGYSYPELLGSLQGPAADDLISLLTERDPNLFKQPQPHLVDATGSLLVIKVPQEDVARTDGVIAALPADRGRSTIVVRGERKYLDWVHVRRCTRAEDGADGASYLCAKPVADRPLRQNWPYVEFGRPEPVADSELPPGVDRSVRFLVPVRTPGRGESHIVRVANQWPSTWQIARVSGVEFEGEVPGPEIRLPDRQEAAGVVEFEFISSLPADLPWLWLPPVVEVTEANRHLLEPLRGPH
jgi:hypothetical protein